MSANATSKIFYARMNNGSGSGEILKPTTKFFKLDFGFNASHIMLEVIDNSIEIGFDVAVKHAQLLSTDTPLGSPRIYENIGVGKIFIKGTSTDVKVTAWKDGRG